MPDERAPMPIADLVPVAKIQKYPTDFKAMADADLQLITTRGEQLTRTLIAHYCPKLV
jgi:NTE family protein